MYQYPYGNAQQLNLDWLMEQWQNVKQSIDGSLQGEIDRVEAAITDLLAARDAAVAAAGAANTSAGAAAQSAQAAAADAATATAQAAAATQERVNAAQAANNAQAAAGTAQTQAAAAQNAAGQAAASASQAAASASDAHDDALAAAASASDAHDDALAAAASASDAAGSASDAAGSASDAHADAVAAQDVLDSIPEDYTALSADVSDLKTAMTQQQDNFNSVTLFINLFDNDIEYGYISLYGGLVDATNAKRMKNFIAVTSGEVYSYTPSKFTQVVEYDSNKAFLNRVTNYDVSQYTPPSNVAFIKLVSWNSSDSVYFGDSYMFVHGNSLPEEYIPYGYYLNADKIYGLDEKLSLVKALIAPVLTEMKADTALSVNDFRIVNNTLYRITSPVASGGTLTPNTNCIATTVTEVIKTLLS